MLDVRAQLALARHDPRAALQDALQAGALIAADATAIAPGVLAWRSTAALAHLALGQPQRARTLAERELTEARRIAMTPIVIRDLRIIGLTLGGVAMIDTLAEAVADGEAGPARLEHTRALIELGAALRRQRRYVEARGPLQRGLDLAHKGGASALEAYARAEMLASGARPRRAASSGTDSLTGSQRRVAELAADGLTTKQIADALFVTRKTVEFHLRETYRKLGVSSREELAGLLRRSTAAP